MFGGLESNQRYSTWIKTN